MLALGLSAMVFLCAASCAFSRLRALALTGLVMIFVFSHIIVY
jgi:hypothetical protein